MFEQTAKLIISVESKDVAEAERRLQGLGKVSKLTEKATGGLMAMAGKLFAVYAAGKAVLAAGSGFANTIREYESLRGQLKTATGSAENALEAFTALQDFAKTTPYDLKQSVEAFVMLTNLGLTPGERALRAYGNMASATGKELRDMATAVARAVAGEYEPLKTFGVAVKKESDGLAVSFRGVTEKIGNDARSIEQYFWRLSENNFARAMEDQMKTLNGAFSNLSDAWDQMYDQIGKMGVGSLIGDTVRYATSMVEEFTARLASGQIEGYLLAIWDKFSGMFTAVKEMFADFRDHNTVEFGLFRDIGGAAIDWLIDAFKNMPENVAVIFRAIGATFKWLGTYSEAAGRMVVDIFKGYWAALVETTGNVSKAIGELITNPLDAQGAITRFLATQTNTLKGFAQDAMGAYTVAVDKATGADNAWTAAIVRAMDIRDASIKKTEDAVVAADKLYAAKQKELAIEKALNDFFGKGDRLARFGMGAADPAPNLSESQRDQFDSLRDSLGLQEEAIARSYEKRKKLIIDNTHGQIALQKQLLMELDAMVLEEYAKAGATRYGTVEALQQQVMEAQAQGRAVELEALQMQLDRELQMIMEANEFKKAAILSDATLTAEEKARRILQIEKQSQAQMLALDRATQSARLSLAADFFGNMASAASAFGKKGAKIAQAAAIAQATIKTYESATSAYASLAGIPYIGPALGAAAAAAAIAAGMANVAAIRSANYSGAYATGGNIPPGSYGLVGETGVPEMVKGPAIVQSARTTQNQLNKPQRGGNVTVNVINNAGVEVETSERPEDDGKVIDIIIRRVKSEVASDITNGGNAISRSFESTYAVRRGVA